MTDTEDIDSETAAGRGVFMRFVLPSVAVFVLMFSVVGSVWEFSQEMSTDRSDDEVFVSMSFDADTPATPKATATQAVEVAELIAPVVQPSRTPVSATPAVSTNTRAVAAISAFAPSSTVQEVSARPEMLAYGAAPEETPATREGTGEFLVVTGNGRLNVRSGPSTEHDKVFDIKVGQRVEIVSTGDGWTEILTDEGKVGWASAAYLLPPEEAERLAEAAKAAETARNTKTAKSGVNARSGPGRNYGTVFTLASGEKVDVTKQSKGWIQVETERGKSGWVYSSYLR